MRRVNLIIDTEELDLKDDTTITLSRQVNNIAELVDRQADYSNQFVIPKTAKNIRLLNKNRYKKVPASVVQYGATTNGYLVITSDDTEYKCQFYSGALNFFNLIDGLKLKDIDWSILEHQFVASNIIASQNHTYANGYVYPIMNTAGDNTSMNATTRNIYAPAMCPALFVRYILDRIADKVGWNIRGKELGTEKVLNAIVPLTNNNGSTRALTSEIDMDNNYINIGGITAGFIIFFSINAHPVWAGQFGTYLPYDKIVVPYGITINDGALQVATDNIAWAGFSFIGNVGSPIRPTSTKTHVAKCDTIFDVNVSLRFAPNKGITLAKQVVNPNTGVPVSYVYCLCDDDDILEVHLVAYANGTTTRDATTPYRLIKKWTRVTDYNGYSMSLNATDLQINKDERMGLVIKVNPSQSTNPFISGSLFVPFNQPMDGLIFEDATIEVYNTRSAGDFSYPVPYLGIWDVGLSVPDITLKEFMKALAQYFCWIYDADDTTNTLNVISFNEIYDNMPIAYDWSDKVDARQETRKYHSDYCRRNEMKFSEDTAPKGYGDSVFYIEDEALKPIKTAVQVAFASTYYAQRWGTLVADYPVWKDTYAPNIFFKTKPKIRILGIYKSNPYSATLNTPSGTATFTQVAFAIFDNYQTFPIDYDYTFRDSVDTHYDALLRSLRKYEMIDESVWLTPQDFLGFNHFRPVYIGKHQAYFYVNKITNFKEGTLTKVELLKLI